MAFTVGTGDVIAFVAFCLALYSTIKTLQFNTGDLGDLGSSLLLTLAR